MPQRPETAVPLSRPNFRDPRLGKHKSGVGDRTFFKVTFFFEQLTFPTVFGCVPNEGALIVSLAFRLAFRLRRRRAHVKAFATRLAGGKVATAVVEGNYLVLSYHLDFIYWAGAGGGGGIEVKGGKNTVTTQINVGRQGRKEGRKEGEGKKKKKKGSKEKEHAERVEVNDWCQRNTARTRPQLCANAFIIITNTTASIIIPPPQPTPFSSIITPSSLLPSLKFPLPLVPSLLVLSQEGVAGRKEERKDMERRKEINQARRTDIDGVPGRIMMPEKL
jgi:hypothetical protein